MSTVQRQLQGCASYLPKCFKVIFVVRVSLFLCSSVLCGLFYSAVAHKVIKGLLTTALLGEEKSGTPPSAKCGSCLGLN